MSHRPRRGAGELGGRAVFSFEGTREYAATIFRRKGGSRGCGLSKRAPLRSVGP